MQPMRRIISLVTVLCFLANNTAFAIDSRNASASNSVMHLAAPVASGDISSDRWLTLARMMLAAYLKRIDRYVGIFDPIGTADYHLATQASVCAAFEKVAAHFQTLKTDEARKEDTVQEVAVSAPDGTRINVTLYHNKIKRLGNNVSFGDVFMVPASVRTGGKSLECRLLFSAKRDPETGNHSVVSYTKEEYDKKEYHKENSDASEEVTKNNELPKAIARKPSSGLSRIVKKQFNISKDPSKFYKRPSEVLQNRYLKTAHGFLERISGNREYDEEMIKFARYVLHIYKREMSGNLRPGDLWRIRYEIVTYLQSASSENKNKLLDIFKILGFRNYPDPRSILTGIYLLTREAIVGITSPPYLSIVETTRPSFRTLWTQYNHLAEIRLTENAPNPSKSNEIARAVLHAFYLEEVEDEGGLEGVLLRACLVVDLRIRRGRIARPRKHLARRYGPSHDEAQEPGEARQTQAATEAQGEVEHEREGDQKLRSSCR